MHYDGIARTQIAKGLYMKNGFIAQILVHNWSLSLSDLKQTRTCVHANIVVPWTIPNSIDSFQITCLCITRLSVNRIADEPPAALFLRLCLFSILLWLGKFSLFFFLYFIPLLNNMERTYIMVKPDGMCSDVHVCLNALLTSFWQVSNADSLVKSSSVLRTVAINLWPLSWFTPPKSSLRNT